MNYQVGDIIQLSTDTWDSYVTIRDIGWGVDAGNNTIDGQIFSGQTGEVSVRLTQSDYMFFNQSPTAEARTDANPNYTLQFDDFDVRAGIYVDTYFYDENGFANHYTEQNHYFQIYNDRAVWGHNTAPGEAITVTVWGSEHNQPLSAGFTNDYHSTPTNFWFDLNGCPQNPPTPAWKYY